MTEPTNTPDDEDLPPIAIVRGPGHYKAPAHLTLANISDLFGVTEDGTLLETIDARVAARSARAAQQDAPPSDIVLKLGARFLETSKRLSTDEAFRLEVQSDLFDFWID